MQDDPTDEFEPEAVLLYESRSRQRCMEYALVLTAMGIASEVLPTEGGFGLAVNRRDADHAQEQLLL